MAVLALCPSAAFATGGPIMQLETLSFPLTSHAIRATTGCAFRSTARRSQAEARTICCALTGALGGSIGPPLPERAPSSIAQLRHQFAGIATYDGIDAKLNGRTKRVYRNGSLLITGKTALSILVK